MRGGDEEDRNTKQIKITLTPVLSKNYDPAIDDSSVNKTIKLYLNGAKRGWEQPHYP